MANNRMCIVNKRLDKRFLLAKYYPSTGWYFFKTTDEEFSDRAKMLNDIFDEDDEVSMFGKTDWVIEYDHMSDCDVVLGGGK